ncbi:MAG: hypothetical protein II937_12150 [Bacteroidales bacterium]|nr:hypothetical protein [Bacteroidales bacterium]
MYELETLQNEVKNLTAAKEFLSKCLINTFLTELLNIDLKIEYTQQQISSKNYYVKPLKNK